MHQHSEPDPLRTILATISGAAMMAAIMLLGFVGDGAIKRVDLDQQEHFAAVRGITHGGLTNAE